MTGTMGNDGSRVWRIKPKPRSYSWVLPNPRGPIRMIAAFVALRAVHEPTAGRATDCPRVNVTSGATPEGWRPHAVGRDRAVSIHRAYRGLAHLPARARR